MGSMTKDQLKKLMEALVNERDELTALSLGRKEDRAPVTLDQQSVGRLSRMDAIQQQSMDLAREERRKHRREMIASALKRIEEDNYGYCFKCGDDIPFKRLSVDPCVIRCIDCQH